MEDCHFGVSLPRFAHLDDLRNTDKRVFHA